MGSCNNGSGGANFAKTICSICYEDLKPFVEDLQSISVCGHVFHELCLQQWFEYCTGKSKRSCPVCKQTCSDKNTGRLYFQSAGDSNDMALSLKPKADERDAEALQGEVRRLEGKVSSLNAILDGQGKEMQKLNDELCLCKEQARKEAALKSEALRQKAHFQQLLSSKYEELDKSNLEISKLQEKNLALAKELAALKLVSDLDVAEDDVLQLASFGNGSNNKETIDVLRRSLVLRNKSFKELIAKCNLLGRGEARYSRKLEKAKAKISKLKTRVQELEAAAKAKDNGVLPAPKNSRKYNQAFQDGLGIDYGSLSVHSASIENQTEKATISSFSFDPNGSLTSKASRSKKRHKLDSVKSVGISHNHGHACNISPEEITDGQVSGKDNASEAFVHGPSGEELDETKHQDIETLRTESVKDSKMQDSVVAPNNRAQHSSSLVGSATDKENVSSVDVDDDVIVLDDNPQSEPVLNIRKENLSPSLLSKPGDVCFAGGLLGPDGTNRYLGKWCKRGQQKGTVASQGSGASTGELIAVGADGRGGRIKVLKSLSQSSFDARDSTEGPKRCKYGAKTSSQGSLQIEHFFERVSRQ